MGPVAMARHVSAAVHRAHMSVHPTQHNSYVTYNGSNRLICCEASQPRRVAVSRMQITLSVWYPACSHAKAPCHGFRLAVAACFMTSMHPLQPLFCRSAQLIWLPGSSSSVMPAAAAAVGSARRLIQSAPLQQQRIRMLLCSGTGRGTPSDSTQVGYLATYIFVKTYLYNKFPYTM